jgi:DNA-binding transcriptional ArsR family regulator
MGDADRHSPNRAAPSAGAAGAALAGSAGGAGAASGGGGASGGAGAAAGESGRFAYGGLDRLIHERARLAILSSLAGHAEGLSFNDLKDLCALTDGNLSRQLQMLRDAELVEIEKGTSGNRPQTTVRLTRGGRKRFLDYIAELERVVSDAAGARTAAAHPTDARRGLSTA